VAPKPRLLLQARKREAATSKRLFRCRGSRGPSRLTLSTLAIEQAMQDAAGEVELRDDEGGLRSDFLHAVVSALDEGDAAKVRELSLPLHEADLADLIALPRPEQRGALIATLGDRFHPAALP